MATDEDFRDDDGFEGNDLELEDLDNLDELEEDDEDELEADLGEDLEEDGEDLDEDGGDLEAVDEGEEDEGELAEVEEELEEELEEEDDEALDVLLARDEVLDDELLRLDDARDALAVPDVPIGVGEFTCRSCFLVKRRAQLADEAKLICLDCA